MSSFWRGTSAKKLADAEEALFRHTGLPEGTYKSYPVEFDFPMSEWREVSEEVGLCLLLLTPLLLKSCRIWTLDYQEVIAFYT
jgi:hypothetical protein